MSSIGQTPPAVKMQKTQEQLATLLASVIFIMADVNAPVDVRLPFSEAASKLLKSVDAVVIWTEANTGATHQCSIES
jgi:hypothetical protein